MADDNNGERWPETQGHKSGNIRTKLEATVDLLSRKGLPLIFTSAALLYFGFVLLGYVSTPWMASARSELMFKSLVDQNAAIMETQKDIADTHNSQTKVLNQVAGLLAIINCDMRYPKDSERLQCYRRRLVEEP